MQTLRVWKNYLVENYHTFASEVAQLGSDAKAEAANIIRDISQNTSEIYQDLATSDYSKVTEGERQVEQKVQEMETSFSIDEEEINEEDKNIQKLDVFSVETYSKRSNPAVIDLRANEKETNLDKQ